MGVGGHRGGNPRQVGFKKVDSGNIWILKAEPPSRLAAAGTLAAKPVPPSVASTRGFAGDGGRSSGKLGKVTH